MVTVERIFEAQVQYSTPNQADVVMCYKVTLLEDACDRLELVTMLTCRFIKTYLNSAQPIIIQY